MEAIQGYLEKFGGNFLVASFVPSLAFVITGIISFGPLVPEDVLERVQGLLSPFGHFWLLILLLGMIVGFTLTSLNTQVYKLYEGYVLTKYLSYFTKQERKRAKALLGERQKIIRKIDRLQNQLKNWEKSGLPARPEVAKAKIKSRIAALRARRDALAAAHDRDYPPDDSLILPTRLGNILRAAEAYPLTRYGINTVPMWPRIIYAASIAQKGDNYLAKVDYSNDQCSFLLNFSLLSAFYTLICMAASLYQYFLFILLNLGKDEFLYFLPIDSEPKVYTQRAIIYLVLALLSLFVSWSFYQASLLNVSQYGNLIRSTFDLFRFNLLESLHIPLPEDSSNRVGIGEQFLWRKLSELISIGHVNSPIHFKFLHPKRSTDSSTNSNSGILK
jgi:hypothetical protein